MKLKNQLIRTAHAKTGFTIIELLTIMSIIIIIIGVLLPALNMINWYAKYTTQRNQFRNIETGLSAFEIDYGDYPDSDALDIDGAPYCGAMKLAEAMAGQDGLGFHPDSRLTAYDGTGQTELYPPSPGPPPWLPWYEENLRKRKEYTEAKDAPLGTLDNLYGGVGIFTKNPTGIALICDVYKRDALRNSEGKKIGMPILYYKADPSKLAHDIDDPANPDNIYNYLDNQDLLALGVRWNPTLIHPLYQSGSDPEGKVFYEKTLDKSALPIKRPYNKNSYILISAGGDGIYGTAGTLRTRDVVNFSD